MGFFGSAFEEAGLAVGLDGHDFGQDGQGDFFGGLGADVEADGAVNAAVVAAV